MMKWNEKTFQSTELIKNMKMTNFSPSFILLQLEKNSFGVKGNYSFGQKREEKNLIN